MATKQFYAIGSFKYQNRMLKSGDGPFPMDGPTAKLYNALGKISPTKPRTARVAEPVVEKDVEAPAPRRRKLSAKT